MMSRSARHVSLVGMEDSHGLHAHPPSESDLNLMACKHIVKDENLTFSDEKRRNFHSKRHQYIGANSLRVTVRCVGDNSLTVAELPEKHQHSPRPAPRKASCG